jgi:hypothetical protein
MTLSTEIERQYRTVDQMISMHSSLGQRYGRRALALNLCLLVSSAILCSLSFAPDNLLTIIGLNERTARFVTGAAGVLVFAMAIVELRVSWQHLGKQHSEAATRLGGLKTKYRAYHGLPDDLKPKMQSSLHDEYCRLMEQLPPIPERWFLKLKAEHHFKRQLSKTIDEAPTAPVSLLRIILRWRGTKQAIKTRSTSLEE